MQKIKTTDVIAYATLPRIIPRAKALFLSGFGYTAFLMAQIFYMVRLLPADHPYLAIKNVSRFGIRHVLLEASNNLKFKKENADQVIIFFAMLSALAILLIQFIFLLMSFVAEPVFASWFDLTNPQDDVSFQILDRVFGIPNMFCSASIPTNCPTTNAGLPKPFNVALQALFRFYSTALLFIAVLIFIYFVFVVILETVTSGTPFGQRFQNVWVPIRLVVAISLLLPLGFGLNSAQYLTLAVAKWGASWATNSWVLFNKTITRHDIFGAANDPNKSRMSGERYTMLAIPQQVDLTSIIATMSLVHACAYANLVKYEATATVADQGAGGVKPHYMFGEYMDNNRDYMVKPYLVKNKADWMSSGTSLAGYPLTAAHRYRYQLIASATAVDFKDAAAFYFGGDIIIRFGHRAEDNSTSPPTPMYSKYEGDVKPICGDIRIPVTSLKGLDKVINDVGGAIYMHQAFYKLIMDLWFTDEPLRYLARSYVTYNTNWTDSNAYGETMCGAAGAGRSGCGTGSGFPACARPACDTIPPNVDIKSERIKFYRARIDGEIRQAWAKYITTSGDPDMNAKILACGWACAGTWFNKIAEINGMFMDGVRSIPVVDKYPLVMEQVSAAKAKINMNVDMKERFSPSVRAMSGQEAPKLSIEDGAQGLEIAGVLNDMYQWWGGDTLDQTRDDLKSTTNPILDVMNFFFGTSGIINMRGANRHMHPLAQLVATGKGLVDSAIKNITLSTGIAFAGGMIGAFDESMGKTADAISRMILSMAFLGLMAGFTLFYVLPFLPFVYFFFAVGTWVKTIFEAMVGTPLWALAHLRIDGEGLPGDAASNGYFLLLEIFIRPMLSVFGLVAAITIFAAQIHVLNIIWDLVINNATGFMSRADILGMNQNASALKNAAEYQRPIMDQFFFMIIFVIIVYMLALASFKLIDQIPNNIMRWAGVGVSAFGDINAEQADAIGGYMSRGGQSLGGEVSDAVRTTGSGLGGGIGALISKKGSGG